MQKQKRSGGCLTSWITIILSFLIFFPVGALLLVLRIVGDNKEKKKQQEFRRYCALIITGRIRRLDQLAAQTGRNVIQVKETIRRMIDNGMLFGAFIDEIRGCVVLPGDVSPAAASVSSPTSVSSPASVEAPQNNESIATALPVEDTEIEEMDEAECDSYEAPREPSVKTPIPSALPQVPRAVATQPQEPVEPPIPFPWFAMGCIAFWLLANLFLGFAIGGGAIVIFIIFDLFLVAAGVFDYFRNKNRLFCKGCRYKYDFDEDVEYREIGHKVKTYRRSENSSDHQVYSREFFKLRVGCTCPHCGKSKQFNVQYLGRETFYDGGIKDHDPELAIEEFFRNGIGGTKKSNLIFVGIGLIVCVIAILCIVFGSGSGEVEMDSRNDPENYYDTYYGAEDGYIYTLKLYENRNYSLDVVRVLDGEKDVQDGTFYYKSEKDIGKILEDEKYDDDALLLTTSTSDEYIIIWLLGEEGKEWLEIDQKSIVLEKDVITPDSYLKNNVNDPKDYYGSYYVIQDCFLHTLTITKNGFTLTTEDFYTESVKTGTYQFVPQDDINGYLSDPEYESKDALMLTDVKGNKYLLWLIPSGSGYKVKINGEENEVMTTSKKTLDIYLDDGKDHSGTYEYSSNNKFTLSAHNNSVTDFFLNGSAKSGFKYTYASSDYIKKRLNKTCDDSIILYNAKGNYYIFEIKANGLNMIDNDVVFQKTN